MIEGRFDETAAVLPGPTGDEEPPAEHRRSGVMVPGPRAVLVPAALAAVDAGFVYAWHKGWIPDPVKAVVTVINVGIFVLALVLNAPGFFRDLFEELERRPYD